jgi:hypothetical protein
MDGVAPRTTPFIEKLTDVRRIYLALPEPLNVAYAIGAPAGLRTGEVFALPWQHVDVPARRIHVRESVRGPLKDKDSRMVPILDALAPILKAWKLKSGGEGRIIPPLRCDGEKIDKHTPGTYLRAALTQLDLARPGLGWYEATRHTFASQWVMAGASIEKLKEILGHYSVVMTERYAHLRPDLFPKSDLGTIRVDLTQTDAEVVQLGLKTGSTRPRTSRNLPELKENGRSRPVSRGLLHLAVPGHAPRSGANVPSGFHARCPPTVRHGGHAGAQLGPELAPTIAPFQQKVAVMPEPTTSGLGDAARDALYAFVSQSLAFHRLGYVSDARQQRERGDRRVRRRPAAGRTRRARWHPPRSPVRRPRAVPRCCPARCRRSRRTARARARSAQGLNERLSGAPSFEGP